MKPETAQQLLAINKGFYTEFAESFAQSRGAPQPGFSRLLEYLPQPCRTVLDIGCGNGRFGLYLRSNNLQFSYMGVDFSEEFVDMAGAALPGAYLVRDLSHPGFLTGQDEFDLSVCLATLQHIPGKARRLAILLEMAEHTSDRGRIFLSNWQFAQSKRQRRKILDWQEAGVNPADVEQGDYLLSWQRDGLGMRYVHMLDQEEITWLADHASLNIVDQFRSDGREGDLNLYTVLARRRLG